MKLRGALAQRDRATSANVVAAIAEGSDLRPKLGTWVPQTRFFTVTEDKEGQYRKRAAECLRVAARTTHEDLRKQYTHLAACYLELAEAEAAMRAGNEGLKRSGGS